MITFVANLGAEVEFGRRALSANAKRKLAAIRASAFAGFCDAEDRVVMSESDIGDSSIVVPWIWTPKLAAHRSAPIQSAIAPVAVTLPPFELQPRVLDIGETKERVRTLQPVDPAIVGRVNDRAWWRELFGDPDANALVDQRDRVALCEAANQGECFVLKARYGSAGQGMTLSTDQSFESRIEELLKDGAIREPLDRRVADFGLAGFVEDAGWSIAVAHRQDVNSSGNFRGLEISRDPTLAPELRDDDRSALLSSAQRAAKSLRAEGYIGPFSIDAYLAETKGSPHFRPCCEINARLTFGHIARTLADLQAPETQPPGTQLPGTLTLDKSGPTFRPHP